MALLKTIRARLVRDDSGAVKRRRPRGPLGAILTTRRYPIYYLPVQKVGCTTLKNLFYLLDRDEFHPDPTRIHQLSEEALVFAWREATVADIRDSGRGFSTVRNPVDRLLSFYFDKVVGDSRNGLRIVQRALEIDYGVDIDAGENARIHRRNLDGLLDFVIDNMAGRTTLKRDPHWLPQAWVLNKAEDAGLKIIPIEYLGRDLERMLGDMIPDIRALLEATPRFNKSPRPKNVPRSALVDDALRERVREVYRWDMFAYWAAREESEARAEAAGRD